MPPTSATGRVRTAVLAVAVGYGATALLVALHHAEGGHERGEPALLWHWLRDGSLALPGVAVAVWIGARLAARAVDRDGLLPDHLRRALEAAGAAVVASVVLGAGEPLHAWLFAAEQHADLPAGLHVGRDALMALAAALPLALGVARPAPRGRRPAGARSAERGPGTAPGGPATARAVTRRAFVGYGAAGLATAGAAGAALSRAPGAARAAAVPPSHLALYVNEGHVQMVDGTMIYMRGFGELPADDPAPSLTIAPQLFRRGEEGPIPGRSYPLVDEGRIPPLGSPTPAGIDGSGPGLHTIRRRHWASLFPRRTIIAETGSQIRLMVTNRLRESHSFTIDGVVDETVGPAGAPDATREIVFDAPPPGTYLFHDRTNAPVNRVLGLHGALVVVPAEAPWTYDGREGEFERQWLWIMSDIDPAWARRAAMGLAVDPRATPCLPRYFALNDRSGVFALAVSADEEENHRALEDTKPSGSGRTSDVRDFSDPATGTGQLIRIVNAGVAAHQPHFHGNHVWTIAIDNQVLPRSAPTIDADGNIMLQLFEDVVEVSALQAKVLMLPLKPPPDALDEVVAAQRCDWIYPMHCHAEMSQTAGGGLYPGGIVSDWILKP